MENIIFFAILLPVVIGLAFVIIQSLIDHSIKQFKVNEYEEKINNLEARLEKLEVENKELYFHIHRRG